MCVCVCVCVCLSVDYHNPLGLYHLLSYLLPKVTKIDKY